MILRFERQTVKYKQVQFDVGCVHHTDRQLLFQGPGSIIVSSFRRGPTREALNAHYLPCNSDTLWDLVNKRLVTTESLATKRLPK